MTKAVVYAFVATAFVILMILSPQKKRSHENFPVNRRLGHYFVPPTFDPLVAKIERLEEENDLNGPIVSQTLEKNLCHDDIYEAYKYINDKERLNITARLIHLFPFVDVDPKDGLISLKELRAWNEIQASERLNYITKKEFDLHDVNGDGLVTFKEYFPQFTDQDTASKDMDHGSAGWWLQKFMNADVDLDGILNLVEFTSFLHPEDSNTGTMQTWLLRERVKTMDYDKDERISFEEFCKSIYDTYKIYLEFETPEIEVASAEDKFAELDVNHDQYLHPEELKPMIQHLVPGEITYARYYASYLMEHADDNKDGVLSLDEMLNNEDVFYQTVFDNGEEDDYHDEL